MSGIESDANYLAQLQSYYWTYRSLPAMARMAKLLGLASTSTVFELVQRFKQQGFLMQGADRRLAPGERFFAQLSSDWRCEAGHRDVLGVLAADTVTIDEALVRHPGRTVLLRVRGHSMRNAGILDGDTVVVERHSVLATGDLVVGIVDGAYTFMPNASQEPFSHNGADASSMPNEPREPYEVCGVVVGVFRSYGGAR